MEEVMEIIPFLKDEDKKKISEFAAILLKQDKYTRLRKEIELRRAQVKEGEVLSHEEIWQDIQRDV